MGFELIAKQRRSTFHLGLWNPRPGNTSHGNPFHAVAGAPYLAEGEAAVIRPLGKDFEIVARVRDDG